MELRHDPRHRLVNPVLYRREEAEACWRAITAPVLMVLGGRSEFHGRLLADGSEQSFRRAFARLSLVTLADAGHMMHHERPGEVAAAILEWESQVARQAACEARPPPPHPAAAR